MKSTQTVNFIYTMTYKLQDEDLNLTMQQLMSFMLICKSEGISASTLMGKCDMHKATASRILRTLSTHPSTTTKNYGLIELRHDDNDYRVRRAFLTDEGKRVRSLITDVYKEA